METTTQAPQFRCSHFTCTLSVTCCLARQTATKQSATRSRKSGRMVTVHPRFSYCASGERAQGNEHAAANPAVEARIVREPFRLGRGA